MTDAPSAGRYTLTAVGTASYAARVPFGRSFFALAQPNLAIVLIATGGCLVAIGGLVLSSHSFIPGRGPLQTATPGKPQREE